MKGYVLHNIGDIRLEDVERPAPEDNEVIVKVVAAGICGSDIPRIYKTGAYFYPLIIGHEFSGIVEEVGKNADKSLIGKRVGIFPLIPCGSCVQCQKGNFELCRKYSYLGSRRNGGFAEYAAVPAGGLLELPSSVTFEEAAMLEPMAVAVHAIRRTEVNKKSVALVCGLGTIGVFTAMFLKEIGVEKVLAVGNKDFQREAAVKLGISEEEFCDIRIHNIDDWVKQKTEGNGVDIFFECVGKNETFINAVNNTAPNGKIMLVGNPYSDMQLEKAVYWKILRNQLTVLGTWNSSFKHCETDDWNYVLNKLEQKKINPADFISHRLRFDEMKKGFEIMRDKKEEYIKIMGIMQ